MQDTREENNFRSCPLYIIIIKFFFSFFLHSAKAGVNPNVSDFKGLTPLMTASMFGKTSTASFLLGMGASHHLTDINGDTALHWASYKGHAELIRLLLYSGADVTKADNFGSTPLHLAVLSGNAKCVKTLCHNVSTVSRSSTWAGRVVLQQRTFSCGES